MSAKPFILNYKKTKYSYRKVPINSLCERYLKQQIKLKEIVSCKRPKQQNDFLFVTKFNTPLNSVIYSDAIKAVIRNINLQRAFDNQFEIFVVIHLDIRLQQGVLKTELSQRWCRIIWDMRV